MKGEASQSFMTILGSDKAVDGGQRGRDAKRRALPNCMGGCMLSRRAMTGGRACVARIVIQGNPYSRNRRS
jgi:hypothetical protein